MDRFLKNFLLFMLPIFILGILIEILLRNIPNDYSYKKGYLDKNSNSIEALFLGSSHAFYDINPKFIRAKSFNAGYISQSLNYDYEILKKYDNHWTHLKYIAIPISYFSLFSLIEPGGEGESWRIKNYTIYYGMGTSPNISDYSELLSSKMEINYARINSYYLLRHSNVTSSELGWGVNFTSNIHNDLLESGKVAAKRHTKDNSLFGESVKYLEAIIQFANENDVKVILYTPPAFRTYVRYLDKSQLDLTIATATQLDSRYQNVVYVNYLTNNAFSKEDFYDADHLNNVGAEKFTRMINNLIDK